jgi:hypothetical protein
MTSSEVISKLVLVPSFGSLRQGCQVANLSAIFANFGLMEKLLASARFDYGLKFSRLTAHF